MNYKYFYILKKEGISLSKFAAQLNVSRPTVYKLLERYDNGDKLKEPIQSIFDAFFKDDESPKTNNEEIINQVIQKNKYESKNGNLVVKLIDNTAENANGTFIKGSETRGKKDIVIGQVIIGNLNIIENTIIYFSYYAGQPFTLDGEEVVVVNELDIKFIKKGGN